MEALCRITTIKQVAYHLGLHWHTVKEIDKRRLQREVQPPDWSKVTRLVMDEFAVHKGHRYAAVIIDADTFQVLWVGNGNRPVDIRPFFEVLGKCCQQIEAAVGE